MADKTAQNPPSIDRSKIIKDSTRYLFATIAGQGFGVVRSVMMPVFLNPAQLGIWNLMNVIIGYGGNAHFGVLHGMNKLVPILRGQGETAQVVTVRESVFWANLILASSIAAGLAVGALFAPLSYCLPLQVDAVIVLLLLIFTYLFSLLRADNRFGLLSMGMIVLAASSTILILACGLLARDHLLGALIGLACSYGLTVAVLQGFSRYSYRFRIDKMALRSSFSLGAPLLLLGVLDTAFLSVDRWVIAARLGQTQLGYYALGIMACNLVSLIPNSVASVLYSRMLERFGANRDPACLQGLLRKPTRVVAVLMAVIVGMSVLVLMPAVRFVLPNYSSSISLLIVLIPGAYFLAVAAVPAGLVTAINKQHWLMGVQGLCIILSLILDVLALSLGWGLLGVAMSTFVAYAVYGLGYTLVSAYFSFSSNREIMRFLVQVFAPFLAMALALLLGLVTIPFGVTLGGEILRTLGRIGLMAGTLSIAFWWCNRDGELLDVMREEFRRRFVGAK